MLYFRSKHNTLKRREKQLLQDLGIISGFKATSELPQWLNEKEQESLREFLKSNPKIETVNRYQYRIQGRDVDFSSVIPIQTSEKNIPVWLAKNAGLLKMGLYQVLPSIWESIKE